MPVIGVTGGVASGKSTVARMLAGELEALGAEKVECFSADAHAHALLENDIEVRSEICRTFGDEALGDGAEMDRARLRERVFAKSAGRKALEGILHPRIHAYWRERCEYFRSTRQYFVAEIPLLYETDSADYFDCIAVVAADAEIQLQRLSSKRGWSLETARRVIDVQMPSEEKIRRADILILNYHTEKLLSRQTHLAAEILLMRHA